MSFVARTQKMFLVLFCILLPGVSVWGNAAPALETVVLQLKWVHQFQFAGFYAAQEMGYYKEAGLQVNFIEGNPNVSMVEEVLSGHAQYGVGNAELLLHRAHGKPVVALAVIFQHSPSVLITRRDSGIDTPDELVGKKVMLRAGVDSAEILAMFINEGISLESITRLDIDVDPNALLDGRADAYHAYETDQPFFFSQADVPISILSPRAYGIDFYGDTLFTSEEELKNHPERVRAFRKASLRGWEYAMTHPDEIIDVIQTRYNSRKNREELLYEAETMREYLRYEAHEMRKLLHPELIELGHMNPGRWKHIADTYAGLGMIPRDYDLTGFLYDPDPKPDLTWIRRVLAVLFILGLFAGTAIAILLIFNVRLKKAVEQRTLELSQANAELERHQEHLEELVEERTQDLQVALREVKTLSGLLPICSSCKKIRDEQGEWVRVEKYISTRSEAEFSHSICPECRDRMYPQYKTDRPSEQ